MSWKHVAVLVCCFAAVVACGLVSNCSALGPQIVTLATFIAGGVIGDARSGMNADKATVPKKETPA